jgi:hypothetical protein
MSEVLDRASGGAANLGRESVALGVANGLSLAATPVFALMACIAGFSGHRSPAMVCGPRTMSAWLGGMIPMYLLMSAFHAGPWLRLITHRLSRGGAPSSDERPCALSRAETGSLGSA